MWLLIDDCRDIGCDVIARNAIAGRKMLAIGGWECVCFDHDLGDGEDGYSVLVWAIENKFLPNLVQLVSSNPVGRANMRSALENDGYVTVNGIDFSK